MTTSLGIARNVTDGGMVLFDNLGSGLKYYEDFETGAVVVGLVSIVAILIAVLFLGLLHCCLADAVRDPLCPVPHIKYPMMISYWPQVTNSCTGGGQCGALSSSCAGVAGQVSSFL